MAENNVPQSVWEEKDRRIVRQSSLKVATDIVLAIEDIVTEDTVSKVKKVAQELTDWVYEKDYKPALGPEPTTLPTPTAVQKKVLDAIYSELYGNNVGVGTDYYKDVLKWAKEVHGISKYPENISSVNDFVKWNNKGE